MTLDVCVAIIFVDNLASDELTFAIEGYPVLTYAGTSERFMLVKESNHGYNLFILRPIAGYGEYVAEV